MKDRALIKVVEGAMPSIVSRVAPDMIGSIAEAVECISNIPFEYFKSKAMIIQTIAGLGESWIQYSVPIAEKIMECVSIAEASNCRKSEMIVEAIFNDSDMTIAEKVELVNKWEDGEHKRKREKVDTVVKGVCAAASTVAFSAATIRVAPILAKEMPSVIKRLSKDCVKIVKIIAKSKRH